MPRLYRHDVDAVWEPSHNVRCQASRGGRQMTTRIRLEPEAQVFAEAMAKPPFLFTLGLQKGRATLDEAQSGRVRKLPVDVEDLTIEDGPSEQVSLHILRPQNV